jgi:hypothetical protein
MMQQLPPLIDDCYMCGDGVVKVGDDWDHDDDLGILADGSIAYPVCRWGKPFAPPTCTNQ